MNSIPVVIGTVGTGFAASFHVENHRRVCGVHVRVKGAASRRPASAQRFVQQHCLEQAYGSVDELLADPEINLVDLCVPNSLHRSMVIKAAEARKNIVCEKPFTAYFGGGDPEWTADGVSRESMLAGAVRNADEMAAAVSNNRVKLGYAENWVYAPAIQRANELLSTSESTILRIVGEESHSGTHSAYGMRWATAGGGSLFNKGCHPLAAALYLKREEGLRRSGRPIRARSVVAKVGNLTRIESFTREESHWIRRGWVDCEDWGSLLLTFEDGSVAQITAGDTTLGGIQDTLSVYSSKLVVHCNLNPNTSLLAYSPDAAVLADAYIREKVETKAGWQFTGPDEDWTNGFPHEMQDFCEMVAYDRQPRSSLGLAREVVVVGYGAYLAAATGKEIDLIPWLEVDTM